MYSTRWVHILMVALAILVATRASFFHHDIEARQLSLPLDDDSSTADDSTPSPTPSDSPTSTPSDETSSTSTTSESTSTTSESTTSDSTTSTPAETTSSTSSTTTSTGRGPITTPTPTPTPTTSSGGGDGGGDPTSNSDETKPTPTPTKKTTFTKTIYYTSTDGNGNAHVSSSESLVVSTPGLVGGGGSKNQGGGLSEKDKSTIIGVTVGVGGAIVLAASGVLFWRLRNKRRNQDENEELISYGPGFGGPGTAEKSEASGPTSSARSPFQSTLETYHAPTQTNAASNF